MGSQYNCEICKDSGSIPDLIGNVGNVPCSCRTKDEKKYVVICYMRVVPENPEHLTFDEARAEVESQKLMQPEHIFRIEPIDPEEAMFGEIDV